MMGMLMNACSYSENENGEKAIPITQVSLIPLPESVVYGTSNIILPNNMSVSQELPDLPAQLRIRKVRLMRTHSYVSQKIMPWQKKDIELRYRQRVSK